MDLKDIYVLSDVINKSIKTQDLPKDMLDKMEIKLKFPPTLFYGIDKEFYYMSNNNSYDGFVHSDVVTANVNGIKFIISSEKPTV